tara:strand:+ start:1693 stop:1881 length:189 start_codon:yes stop_codon:yes gene_type:complete
MSGLPEGLIEAVLEAAGNRRNSVIGVFAQFGIDADPTAVEEPVVVEEPAPIEEAVEESADDE